MNWHEFIAATDRTAIYPKAGTGCTAEFCYVALGLAGEVGEAIEATTSFKEEIMDALWYVARGMQALKVHGHPYGDVRHGVISRDAAPLLIANTTKKLLRDGIDSGKLDLLRALYQEALDSLYAAWCEKDPEADFELALDKLIAKLDSRKDRGVLHGSGDNR